MQNTAEHRHGGAISVKRRAKLTTRECHYIGNRGRHGGALHLDNVVQPSVIERCILARNVASIKGGSIIFYVRAAVVFAFPMSAHI